MCHARLVVILGAMVVALAAPSASAIDYVVVSLHPADWDYSPAYGVHGTQQVGKTENGAPGFETHAALWNGTADSAVDLNPDGFDFSFANKTNGVNQVGYGRETTNYLLHALLWSGTAASAIDLHPGDFTNSQARDVAGGAQVGYGDGPATGGQPHALLWQGTAESVVDLHPAGFDISFANAASATSQVGYAENILVGHPHAMLWHGTAASAVDLHPAGFNYSFAIDASDFAQVGYGSATGGLLHALLWTGSAASVVDLHPFVTAIDPTALDSVALGINDNGDIVGYAVNDTQFYAILWRRVPEPSSVALLISGWLFAALVSRRRRR